MAVMEEKSLFLLIPIGGGGWVRGGAVVTNG